MGLTPTKRMDLTQWFGKPSPYYNFEVFIQQSQGESESWQIIANLIAALLADYPYVDTSGFCAAVTEAVRSNDLSQASNLLEIQPLADSHIWPALAKLFKAFNFVSPDYELPPIFEELAQGDGVRWNQDHALDEVINFVILGDD